MRAFTVPRGITVLAAGHAEPDASSFDLAADVGSAVFGICSNPFLDVAFRTVRYTLHVDILGDDDFQYEEDTILQMPGRAELFHHTDKHRLKRAG